MFFGFNWILAVVVAGFVGSAGAYFYGHKSGYEERDLQCKAEVSAMKSAQMELERRQAAIREQGRVLADKLATQLADAKASISNLKTRIDREIQIRARADRRAMDGALTRLLNEQSTIRESVSPAAPAAPGVAQEAEPAAPDRDRSSAGWSSERAVATALLQARSGYEACRAQLHKLIDYVKATTE